MSALEVQVKRLKRCLDEAILNRDLWRLAAEREEQLKNEARQRISELEAIMARGSMHRADAAPVQPELRDADSGSK